MILNIYKPKDWTSNDVVQKIKHSCGFKKVGHAGTLDPLAEGVLVVLTDGDTKKQDEFMGLKKEYLVKIVFGFESDSHDLGTPVRPAGAEAAQALTRERLQSILGNYTGKIQQQVPVYSAVHVKGQRLYKAARSGSLSAIDPPFKDVEIFGIEVCKFIKNERLDYPELNMFGDITYTSAELLVSCGKGTYIRSLLRDIGKDLDCEAVAVSLTRTKVGNYASLESLTLEEFIRTCAR